jgi:hypothetical protein
MCDRKYSTTAYEAAPVDEFDYDPPTVEIPAETMAALVYGPAVVS